MIILMLTTYILNAVVLAPFLGIAFFFKSTRKKLSDRKAMFLLSNIIPMSVWLFMGIFEQEKTLSNAFVEPVLLGISAGIVDLVFIYRNRYDKLLWIILLFILPVAVTYFVPFLPE